MLLQIYAKQCKNYYTTASFKIEVFYLLEFLIAWSLVSFCCKVILVDTHRLWRWPEKSCKPTSANTHRKNVVNIKTSDNIRIDFSKAFTIVFKPKTKIIFANVPYFSKTIVEIVPVYLQETSSFTNIPDQTICQWFIWDVWVKNVNSIFVLF